jgi:MtN3 and saliva related transmembrane protein
MTEIIGWVSSFILLLTIGRQIWKQWHDDSSEGVSKWLFIGQVAASVGFTIYSWLLRNYVFIATNLLMLLSALLGLGIVFHHRRRAGRGRSMDDRSI